MKRRMFQWVAPAAVSLSLAAIGVGLAAGAASAEKKERIHGKFYPSLELGVNLTQSAYSNNWAGGDKGSVVWTAILSGTLENQLNAKVNWLNILKLAFGQTHQQKALSNGGREWEKPEKSTDLVDFETIFRFTMGGYVDPYVSSRVESQFLDASDTFGRQLTLNPVKIKESVGIARQFVDEEDRSLLSRLGFTLRQSVRSLFTDPAPLTTTKREVTNDGGLEWITDYKTRILDEKVSWTSKLTLYQPVFFSSKDALDGLSDADLDALGLDRTIADYTTSLDIDFENIFTSQITKQIAVNLYTRWVYDKYDNSVPPKFAPDGTLLNPGDLSGAVRKAGQFQQTMAIGITYRFL